MNASRGIAALLFAMLVLAGPVHAADSKAATAEPTSLITTTPAEGFALAVKLSRLGVKSTQPDVKVLHELRPGYSTNADSLIAASHVVAIHFQTIAAANDYWQSVPEASVP